MTKYTKDEKIIALNNIIYLKKTISQTSKKTGIPKSTLYKWIKEENINLSKSKKTSNIENEIKTYVNNQKFVNEYYRNFTNDVINDLHKSTGLSKTHIYNYMIKNKKDLKLEFVYGIGNTYIDSDKAIIDFRNYF